MNSQAITQNRIETAFASALHATCMLKGAGSVVAHFTSVEFVNTTGNVGLASGSTGDVLSGIISSFLAQGIATVKAAKLGVYIHGKRQMRYWLAVSCLSVLPVQK